MYLVTIKFRFSFQNLSINSICFLLLRVIVSSNIRVKFVSLSFTFVHNHFENSGPEPSCEIYKAFCLLIVKYALILLLEYTDLNKCGTLSQSQSYISRSSFKYQHDFSSRNHFH